MIVAVAALMVTDCCAEPAEYVLVAAVLAWITHIPAPVELNVPPLTCAQGPLT